MLATEAASATSKHPARTASPLFGAGLRAELALLLSARSDGATR